MTFAKRTVSSVPTGTLLHDGRFLVRKKLNAGATAVVHEAWDKQKGTLVALKVLRMCNGRMMICPKLLKREVECASSIEHENVAQLRDLFAVGFQIVLVWEFIDGMDLLDLINERGGKFSEEEAAFYLYQIVKAVEFLHGKGFCHGDIKAENCMVQKDSKVTKIIDFGLSRRLESANPVGAGTPDYMSPELIQAMRRKDVDVNGKAVDVWALGILLYLLVTGTYPFEDARGCHKTTQNVIEFKIRPLPKHVSQDCAALIKSMIAFKPENRVHAREILTNPWLVKNAQAYGTRFGYTICSPASQTSKEEVANETVKFKGNERGKRRKLSSQLSWKSLSRRFTAAVDDELVKLKRDEHGKGSRKKTFSRTHSAEFSAEKSANNNKREERGKEKEVSSCRVGGKTFSNRCAAAPAPDASAANNNKRGDQGKVKKLSHHLSLKNFSRRCIAEAVGEFPKSKPDEGGKEKKPSHHTGLKNPPGRCAAAEATSESPKAKRGVGGKGKKLSHHMSLENISTRLSSDVINELENSKGENRDKGKKLSHHASLKNFSNRCAAEDATESPSFKREDRCKAKKLSNHTSLSNFSSSCASDVATGEWINFKHGEGTQREKLASRNSWKNLWKRCKSRMLDTGMH